jgi:formate dehydrogenase
MTPVDRTIHRSTDPGAGLRPRPKGRPVDPTAVAEIRALLGDAPRRRDLLVECLHKIQDAYRSVSTRHLAALAHAARVSYAEVFEVATFYHHFEVVEDGGPPDPRLAVRVCDGLCCHLAGAEALIRTLRGSGDSEVRVQPVSCVGRCESAPVAVAGQNPIPRATADSVLGAVRAGATEEPTPAAIRYPAYRAHGGYTLLADLSAGRRTGESVMAALEDAGLRGLGGAGFPAGRKWRIVRGQPPPRLLAVNLDEGEPGTFKDRYYAERDPHRFLEGVLLAASAVGLAEVFIYIRDEYPGCRRLLLEEVAALQCDPPIPGTLPPIHVRRGAGAYICGEESAMIESIEGKRGMPRLRPPFVAEAGLFGRPTLVHNFETLYWVRDIVEKGPAWFTSHGRHGRKGLRSFSVSGRVNAPGVYLAPAGISARGLIEEYCGGMPAGHTLYAYLPGGASGGILPASLADVPLDFDTLTPHGCFIGSAGVIVLSQHDSARDAALNVMRFFARESCGQCTPCRVGTEKAMQLMQATAWDAPLLEELSQAMVDASICALGQAAPNPIRCVLKYFPHEVG